MTIKINNGAIQVKTILSIDSDPKTAKSNRANLGYYTAIHYGAPAMLSGFNTCASATVQCIAGCLHTAGNPMMMPQKSVARIARTRLFFQDRQEFKSRLFKELESFRRLCRKHGLKPAVRLNGTTDIVWERIFPDLFTWFADVQFYDYTKHVKRVRSSWVLPSNYHLTLSRSEDNQLDCLEVLRTNSNARVAVVFDTKRTKALPDYWQGYPIGDADMHDLRFLDRLPIVGLRAKGSARGMGIDENGFVVATKALV